MGFWNILADVGLGAAAPFTGGASLAMIPAANAAINGLTGPSQTTAGSLSQNMAGGAAGLANQRGQGAQIGAIQGGLAQKLYQDALNRYLTGAVSMPTQGAEMAKRGDLLANVQDVQPQGSPYLMSHVLNFSGGLRPSALGPNARQAGQNLSSAGLNLQNAQGSLPPLWQMPQIQNQPGGLESGLQYGALGTGVLDSLLKSRFFANKLGQGPQGSTMPPMDPSQVYGPTQVPPDISGLDPNVIQQLMQSGQQGIS